MTRRTAKSIGRRSSGSCREPLRLLLEPLEARRLLAGVHVSVYVDQDGSRSFDPTSDAPAPNRLVYIDLNTNGLFDRSEPVAVTGDDGTAFFGDLAAGDYAFGLITNPATQPQVEPVRISQPTQLAGSDVSSVLVSSDLSDVWLVDNHGTAGRLPSSDNVDESTGSAFQAKFDLGGQLQAWTNRDEQTIWAIVAGEDGQRLVEFSLETGEITASPIVGLEPGLVIRDLVQTSTQAVAAMSGPNGNALGVLRQQADGQVSVDVSSTTAQAISASESSQYVVAVSSLGEARSLVTLLNPGDGFATVASLTIQGVADAISFSASGDLAFVSLDEGGVIALAVQAESLALAAILSDAAGPVVADSSDGRIVTGSIRSAREIIVWDRKSWTTTGRSSLPVGSELTPSSTLMTDRQGNLLFVRDTGGLHQIELAAVAMQPVTLENAEQEHSIRLGVRTGSANSAPDVSAFGTRTIEEDSADDLDLRTAAGIRDADGDTLWFTLAEPARHGSFELFADGSWSYSPDANFSGVDSARIQVHDGQVSTELVIHWQVAAVNDPPESFLVDVSEIPEDISTGSDIGYASIVDADRDAQYRITTSDPRFIINSGRIYFVGGNLDFESEDDIQVEFLATDLSDSSISISALANIALSDVDEPPTAIRLSNNRVPENVAGATVGRVDVIDPDANSVYVFTVSDARFTIVNGELKLVPNAVLDYESESSIDLTVSATDLNGSHYDIVEQFTLSVVNQNDTPLGIVLSGLQIEEKTPGAVVGEIYVNDPDDDFYEFGVSDGRFEVVGSQLKLRDSEELDAAVGSSLNLTVSATGLSGDSISASFLISVVNKTSPYHNLRNPRDVNGDGIVSPLDVLIIINDLNENGSHPVPSGGVGTGEPPSAMPDVNGDGIVSPLDALLIINELNDVLISEDPMDPEGEGPAVKLDLRSIASPFDLEDERRRRANDSLDAELEGLLDQLAGLPRS